MQPAKPSVLVTGGAGFIGSHLIEALVLAGYRVTVFDNFSHCRPGQLDHLLEKISVFEGDMLDESAVAKATKDQNYIFHLAAQKSIDQSIRDPVGSAKQNIIGFVNLLHHAVQNKVQRVFFASSASIYGFNSDFPLKESAKLDPQSPYALEKVMGEQYLSLFYKLYGLDSAAFRLFNVYGPRQYSSSTHCGGVTIVMNEILHKNCINMLGDGKQTRDLIYVGDVVSAMIQGMTAEQPLKGDAYNICRGTRESILELQKAILDAMGKTSDGLTINSLPFADGNVVHSQGDPTLAKTVFGFEAKTNLAEGVRRTWEWFQATPNFYA